MKKRSQIVLLLGMIVLVSVGVCRMSSGLSDQNAASPFIVPDTVRVDPGATVTAAVYGGEAPYNISIGCDEADVSIQPASSSAPMATILVKGLKSGRAQVVISDKNGDSAALSIIVNASAVRQILDRSVVLFTGSPTAYVRGAKAMIDPFNANVVPVLKNNRVLVPVRFIAESMGADVSWDPGTSTAHIVLQNTTVDLTLGSSKMLVNNAEIPLDVPADTLQERIFIPLRALVTALGKTVFWDDRGLILISDSETITDPAAQRNLTNEMLPLFDINIQGNSAGNSINSGLAVKQGSWLYYSNGSLYRSRLDGSEKTSLDTDNSWFINVCGEWIYYCNASEDYKKLYRMKIDGTEKTLLIEDKITSIAVFDEWIYYCNASDGESLYKVRTDGSEKTRLNYEKSEYINVDGSWIYYCNSSDGYKLYKIRTDGTQRTKLNDDRSLFINVSGEWLYYTNSSDNDSLYKIKTDGTDKTKLNYDKSWFVNVTNEWVYYCNASDGEKIYRMRTDGTDKNKISDHRAASINVVDEAVYYWNGSDAYHLYRITPDGKEDIKVEK